MRKIKKLLALLVCAAMALTALPGVALAEVTDDGLEYEVYDDHVEITGYTGNSSELVIPDEIEGLPVTAIADYAFYGCYRLRSVLIPDGVTDIGTSAFNSYELYVYYTGSEEEWANVIIRMNNNSLEKAEKVFDVHPTLDGGLCYSVFDDRVGIIGHTGETEDLIIPEKIEGRSVTDIYALFDFAGLKTLTLPSSVERINAKYYIYGSSSNDGKADEAVLICDPGSYAEEWAVSNRVPCQHPDGARVGIYWIYRDGTLTVSEISGILSAVNGLDIKKIVIEDGVTEIPFSWYSGTGVTSDSLDVYIPESVKKISAAPFWGAMNVNLYAPKGSYGERFAQSLGYPYAELGGTPVNELGEGLTWSYDNGTLTIEGTGSMPDFSDVDDSRMSTCCPWRSFDIHDLVVKDGVTDLGDSIYPNPNRHIKNVILPDSLEVISGFYNCIADNVVIPKNLKRIIKFPCISEYCTTDGGYAEFDRNGDFYDDDGTFYYKNCLIAVNDNFSGDVVLRPDTVCVADNVLSNTDTSSYYIDESNPNYTTEDGVLYNKDKTVLIKYPADKPGRSFTVPDSVTEIYDYAFWYSSLEEVVLHDGIKKIGKYAFAYSDIADITIPDTVESIGEYVLYYTPFSRDETNWDNGIGLYAGKHLLMINHCESYDVREGTLTLADTSLRSSFIERISLPKSLLHIGDEAFAGAAVETLVIPENVETIGDRAFHRCSNLRSVTIPSSVTYIGPYAFGIYGDEIHGTAGSYAESYANANVIRFVDLKDVPAPEIENAEIMVDEITGELDVAVETENIPTSAALVAVGYGADGNYVGMADVEAGSATLPAEGIENVKVFCWESLRSIRPLCPAKEVTVQ